MQGNLAAKQLSSLEKKIYPRAQEVSLKLLEKKSNKTTTLTLSEALTRLGPCTYLTKTGAKAKADDGLGVYSIEKFPDPEEVQQPKRKGPHSPRYYKRSGRGKEIHITTTCDPRNLRHRLMLSYRFLLEGSRMELHLHEQGGNSTATVDRALAHSLHLRPDTILAAMPRDTTMLALPATTDFSHRVKLPASANRGMSEVMWAMENGPALKCVGVITPEKIKLMGQWNHERGSDPRRRRPKNPKRPNTWTLPKSNLADLLPPETPESSATPLSA